ncbi:hypothetical protein V6N13_123320 [Hibiscus sabdariffa]
MEPAEGNSVPQPVSMLLEEGSTANAQAESDVESRVVTDVSNRHPMITRSKNEIVKPKVYVATADDETREPVTIQQALQLLKWTELKRNPDGSVHKYKARLVAKGYSQVPGHDFKHTFSPFIKSATLNVVLSLAIVNGWKLRQVDVNNTFLNGDLGEYVFMKQPPGFEQVSADDSRLVCKLQKALCGLRQASHN